MNEPSTMRAFVVEQHGGPEALVLRHREVPQPAPGAVRLRVEAVSLNHLDLWVRRGVPGHRFPLPLIPGCDIAGTVEAIGEGVTRWRAGDRVLVAPGIGCGLCAACLAGNDHLCRSYGIFGETRDGGCAEYFVVPQTHLLPHPPQLTTEEASAIPLTLLTAWHMLVGRARVRPGETVLVHGAAGGVGIMAVQVARLFGAEVLATAGSAGKAAIAASLGAGQVVLYREVDFVDEIRRLTGKRGVDIVIDHAGGGVFEGSVRVLAKGGRLVNCGATAGAAVTFDVRMLFFKALSFLGSTMGSRGELEEAWAHVMSGRIRPVLDRVFDMEELPQAHERLESREALGKVVVHGFGRGKGHAGFQQAH